MQDKYPPLALMLADIENYNKVDAFNAYAGTSSVPLLIAVERFWETLEIPF